jgi:hypothetical protein
MKLNTVNVLETIGNLPQNLHSFKEDNKGNKEAEALFTKLAKVYGAAEADMPSYIEDGIYECGNYSLYLIHST